MLINADEVLEIPMYGFTRSYNISVSAAIILYNITARLRVSRINWQLPEDERIELKLRWIKNSLKLGDGKVFHTDKGKENRDLDQG